MIKVTSDLRELSSQRVDGFGAVSIRHKDGRSRIARLYQAGAAKIRMPRTMNDPLETVLINTSGGLTGGDRLRWEVGVETGASAVVTTQACERIYRSAGGESLVSSTLMAAKGTRLAWLPQETILFNGAVLSRKLDVDVAADAEVLISEATLFGRQAMGETVEEAHFHDRWRVRVGGRLVHAEDFRLGPKVADQLGKAAVAGGARAVATVLLIAADAERRLARARDTLDEQAGVSVWRVGESTKLAARLYAPDGYTLRKRLMPLLALLNGQAGLPKVWSI
ncbi:urease accessory protein UreD [Pseudaminobacter salicylatoxidans]|uniref:urease accessory protein UreD n=1 Tax=Pseudaminobacter salicylatoxidans TaxID=93369 RepID=UPI0002D64A42|nr:urease accessory protein UreD [Pseudaminobacter salicylatoxidans]